MKYKRKHKKLKIYQVGKKIPKWIRELEGYSFDITLSNDGINGIDNIVLEKSDHKITVNAGDFLIYEEGLLYSCYYAQFKRFFKKEAKK